MLAYTAVGLAAIGLVNWLVMFVRIELVSRKGNYNKFITNSVGIWYPALRSHDLDCPSELKKIFKRIMLIFWVINVGWMVSMIAIGIISGV